MNAAFIAMASRWTAEERRDALVVLRGLIVGIDGDGEPEIPTSTKAPRKLNACSLCRKDGVERTDHTAKNHVKVLAAS